MKWLDRAIVVSPVYYGLCLSKRDFRKELRRLGIKERVSWLSPGAGATTHMLDSDDGRACAIVCLGDHKGRSLAAVHALLVHEAVHVWQKIRETINERDPSSEFEAYSLQSIALELFAAYHDATAGEK